MKPFIVIHGAGLLTPLGDGVDVNWRALLDGVYITDHGRVHDEDGTGIESANSDAMMPRVDHLAARALREAIDSPSSRFAGSSTMSSRSTALVVGSSRGSVDDWLGRQSLPELLFGFGLSTLATRLATMFGYDEGPRLTFSSACASGLHALIRAVQLIERGVVDRAVVIAAESSLHPIFLQSFRRLGVLSPPGGRCRPFDVHRQGLLVSEAAAAVAISRVDDPRPDDVLIDQYGFAGDAAHLTGFDPEGRTIRRMLATAIDGRPVDVIHAHGTGTPENDAAEAVAIEQVFSDLPRHLHGDQVPVLYSHKGAIGHSLGASGLVSVVLNLMMHREGVVPGNISVETPMPITGAMLSRDPVRRSVRRSVVCAAGFGGATATISLATAGTCQV